MLPIAEVERLAAAAASRGLGLPIVSAHAEPTLDSVGDEALQITAILPPGTGDLSGPHLTEALLQIRMALAEADDLRWPIVRFATEEELADLGDPES